MNTSSLRALTLAGLASVAALSAGRGTAHAQARDAGAPLTAVDAATRAEARSAVASLSDPDATVRDAAAQRLRALHARAPGLVGTAAAWNARLAHVRPGSRVRDFVRAFHATSEGGGSSGHSTSEVYRLDDFWAVQITSDDNGTIRLVGTAQPSVRHLWVAPPPHFTGRWVTYFTNGIASHDIAFRDGAYERFRAFHDNGQLAYEQRYVNGQIDGDETGFDRDGHTSYAIHHAAGQNVGRWVHFYPTGRMQSEEHYVAGQLDGVSTRWRPDGSRDSISHYAHGQETGQAAWDEHGTLLYAHGTAASEVRDH